MNYFEIVGILLDVFLMSMDFFEPDWPLFKPN